MIKTVMASGERCGCVYFCSLPPASTFSLRKMGKRIFKNTCMREDGRHGSGRYGRGGSITILQAGKTDAQVKTALWKATLLAMESGIGLGMDSTTSPSRSIKKRTNPISHPLTPAETGGSRRRVPGSTEQGGTARKQGVKQTDRMLRAPAFLPSQLLQPGSPLGRLLHCRRTVWPVQEEYLRTLTWKVLPANGSAVSPLMKT